MKLDLGSWAVNVNIKTGTATPSWGTALGQGKGYLYTFSNQAEYISAMDAHSVDEVDVYCPLGKGGNKQSDFRRVRTALFDSIILHVDDERPKKIKSKFIIIEVEQLKNYHAGRKSIKYSPNCSYKKGTTDEFKNQDSFDEIERTLQIDDNCGWFVSQLEFENNEIHIYAHVVRKTNFEDFSDRKRELLDVLNKNFVTHNTTLESAVSILKSAKNSNAFGFRATRSDCMNDPNECIYGEELYSRLLDSSFESYKPFILSFSKMVDDPVMWRLYQAQIQMVFNKTIIEKNIMGQSSASVKLLTGDVLYAEVNDIETGEDFMNELGFAASKENYLSTMSRLKPKDYEVEKEWRVCSVETNEYKQPELVTDLDDKTGVSTRYGLVKLFRVIDIPVSALREIIVYEFDEYKFNLIKKQLENLLERVGINKISITQTECAKFRN